VGTVEEPSSGLAEFEALNRTQGARCQWNERISSLSEGDRALLDAALVTMHIQHTAVMRWLEARGVATNKTTVARHRPHPDGTPTDCQTCRTPRT
jgi:hypothetical protein